MLHVACLLLITAATSALSPDAPPQAARSQFASEEALRRYLSGRLLEERGARDQALSEYYRALLLDERSPGLARRASEVSAVSGDPARALEFAERALGLDPEDARSLWLKGTSLLNLGRAGEALPPLQAATARDSDRVEYFRTLARAAETLDQYDLVTRSYRRAVLLDPEDGESWFQLAAGEARLGRFRPAQVALVEAVERNPLRPGVLFLQGWVGENLGQPQQAIDLYRQHLRVHPDDQMTRRRTVSLLARERRFADAFREARVLARAVPDDREARTIEADLAFAAGQVSQGTELLARLRRERPDDPRVVEATVAVLARHGRTAAAVAEAEAWSAKQPGNVDAHLLAARARSLNKEPKPALAHLHRAIELAPDSLAPRVSLARFHEMEKRHADAERVWSETAARFPRDDRVAFDLASSRERLGDIRGAEAAVRDVLRRHPDHPPALNFLGYLWADHNLNLEEAVALIVRALAVDPDNGAYIDSLGWAYYRLGRLQQAREQLERAASLTGGDPVVLEHLGDVYKDLALKEMAKEQYRLSLTADPANDRVKAKLESLR